MRPKYLTPVLFSLLDEDSDGSITASDLTSTIQKSNMYKFSVGDRVKVKYALRHGILKFIGPTKFAEGNWAGLELEEATGAHNGTVEGVSYFQVGEKHGA